MNNCQYSLAVFYVLSSAMAKFSQFLLFITKNAKYKIDNDLRIDNNTKACELIKFLKCNTIVNPLLTVEVYKRKSFSKSIPISKHWHNIDNITKKTTNKWIIHLNTFIYIFFIDYT